MAMAELQEKPRDVDMAAQKENARDVKSAVVEQLG